MNSFTLCMAYLRHKLLGTVLNALTFASGVAIMVALLLITTQLSNQFTKNLQGIDLVVGAKGSPLQLILSSVFHLDAPTGNIPLEEAAKLGKHPLIKNAVPLALGDNYNGFRIVGTSPAYIDLYNGKIGQGRLFSQSMEAVIGSEVEEKYRLKPGEQIIGAHGLANSDDLHNDFPYNIVGILKPTGTVLDRLVLTPVESVWHVHEHPDPDDAEEVAYKKKHPGKELTALLLAYKTPLAAASMPREVNTSTSMQAASPAFEVARLTGFMGVGADIMRGFGWFLMALAVFGIFTALYNAMSERRYDLALMRSFGASPTKLFRLMALESTIIALAGGLLGIAAGHALVQLAAIWLAENKHIPISGAVFMPEEYIVLIITVLAGLVAGMLPAIGVYRIDIFQTLVRK